MEQMQIGQGIDLLPIGAIGAAFLRFILAGLWIAYWWYKVGYRGMSARKGSSRSKAFLSGWPGSISVLRASWRSASFAASVSRFYL
jgi:hypothetical protein